MFIMSLMSKKSKKNNKKPSWYENLHSDTKHSIWAIFSFALALVLTLAYFGNAGLVGEAAQGALELIFGNGFFLAPLMLFILGLSFLFISRTNFVAATLLGGMLFLGSSLGLADILMGERTGGFVGYFISYPLLTFFDFWASLVVFVALLFVSVLVMFNVSLKFKRKEKEQPKAQPELKPVLPIVSGNPHVDAEPAGPIEPASVETDKTRKISEASSSPPSEASKEESIEELASTRHAASPHYTPPPFDLLENDRGKPSSGDLKANANIIKRTLVNFGIDVEMAEINVGPSVTQYTLRPAEGIKLSRIVALQNDLALALSALPLRIEAPVPGKPLVGIEIPNISIALVGLKTLLATPEFQTSPLLTFTLGRDVTGKSIYADLARMPHLLVAGATGSGKSIAIHTMITSFLYKNSPEFLRFLIIDPKRVELAVYNEIPHLLTPVVTDAKRTVQSLRWAVKEMERRYEKLSEIGARDIDIYNREIRESKDIGDILPNIVIVIDELADLIAAFPREIESSIVRLAQMSRAVGIHLIVATQRPSVEVITGLIKANITSRIALQVASSVDSRTILDMSGAEKLLGNGDMLYMAGDTSKPKRIQGAFISEKEVKRVVSYVAKEAQDFEAGEIDLATAPAGGERFLGASEEDADDDLYEEAKNLVIEAQKASASYLQRRLKVGYARAARLLDMLEEQSVIGPGFGAKPREVFVKSADAFSQVPDSAEAKLATLTQDDVIGEPEKKSPKSSTSPDIPYTNFG